MMMGIHTVLQALDNLHKDNNNEDDDCQLSLKQLVAVHESFLVNLVNNNDPASSTTQPSANIDVETTAAQPILTSSELGVRTTTTPFLNSIPATRTAWTQVLVSSSSSSSSHLSEAEHVVKDCLDVILLEESPSSSSHHRVRQCQILCALQYLRHVTTTTSIEQGLCCLLFPMIQIATTRTMPQASPFTDNDNDDSLSSSESLLHLLLSSSSSDNSSLLDVLLYALGGDGRMPQDSSISRVGQGDNNTWLALALSLIRQWDDDDTIQAPARRLLWSVLTRCLLWLLDRTKEEEDKAAVESALWTVTRGGLRRAIALTAEQQRTRNDDGDDHKAQGKLRPAEWLQPILQSLLPRLWPSHADALWHFVWNDVLLFSRDGDDSSLPVVVDGPRWTVGTTLLCALVPQTMGLLPQHHAQWLWQVVRTCLPLGIRITAKKQAQWLQEAATAGNSDTAELEASVSELLRRRALYLLRWLVERRDDNDEPARRSQWLQYVACLETLELETEPHLIEQVWETVQELASHVVAEAKPSENNDPQQQGLSLDWIRLLWARVLLSPDAPALRKASLCHFCMGQAGVVVVQQPLTDSAPPPNQGRKNKKEKQQLPRGVPLALVSHEFVVHVVLPSLDSLEQSVGTHHHYLNAAGKTVKQNMTDLVATFVRQYLQTTRSSNDFFWSDFLGTLFDARALSALRHKTTAWALELVAHELLLRQTTSNATTVSMPDLSHFVAQATGTLSHLFSLGYILPAYRTQMVQALAQILSCLENDPPAAVPDAQTLMKLLHLYHPCMPLLLSTPTEVPSSRTTDASASSASSSWIDKDLALLGLQTWLQRLNQPDGTGGTGRLSTLAPTIATAFVDGALASAAATSPTSSSSSNAAVCSTLEQDTAQSIVLLCALLDQASPSSSASEWLWPAIHKGLSLTPSVLLLLESGNDDKNRAKVGRAMALLDWGCQLQLLSGNGNGDLIVLRENGGQMLAPPPAGIEQLLEHAALYLMAHLRQRVLLGSRNNPDLTSSSRSSDAKRLTGTYLDTVGRLETLKRGYPSSLSLARVLEAELSSSLLTMAKEDDSLLQVAMAFACLSGGAQLRSDKSDRIALAERILTTEFGTGSNTPQQQQQQPLRSIFHCAKWGSLDLLAKQMLSSEKTSDTCATFLQSLFAHASDSIEACPSEGLLFLFHCIVSSIQFFLASPSSFWDGDDSLAGPSLTTVIDTLFAILEAADQAPNAMYILKEMSSLLFHSDMLLAEQQRYQDNNEAEPVLREAFRRLRALAGTQRPHILRVVLAQICASWLGGGDGRPALLYREEIMQLLYYKEDALEASSMSTSTATLLFENDIGNKSMAILKQTHEQSVARAFVMCFLDRLPHADKLDATVHRELLQFLVLRLLRASQSKTPGSGQMAMLGSPEYCQKIRSWQALCLLSRFVVAETDPAVVGQVCELVLQTLREPLHGQVRYFVEVFFLQCARKHRVVFGRALVEQMARRDLNLQEIASFMVLAGNLVVGKYRSDFLRDEDKDVTEGYIHKLLQGATPWLSSTQGFSRAIAQLLVHALIPMVVDVAIDADGTADNDWHLRSLYHFLDDNPEMKRLRNKQLKFFEQYDADWACTPGFLFTKVPVDEGGDANPVPSMVDLIKQSLVEVYHESHDAPVWKRAQELLEQSEDQEQLHPANHHGTGGQVNFQRKIIPLETLNLALEQSYERRLRNCAGRRKQPLIVCASLIDKLPNLGGLARTAEIFAATALVLPDKQVTKLDSFTNLSVGAGDWISIEECNEENLLRWLIQKRNEGFVIVGVEQTSSSVGLLEYQFPDNRPVVLLLGKEKEGIAVKFLAAVDQCVEIPQLGIIRSLNVHVSGAIAIWEYTRQQILSGQVST